MYRHYSDPVWDFLALCAERGSRLSARPTSTALARLNHMFFEGRVLALGAKLVYGWTLLFPRFRGLGDARATGP